MSSAESVNALYNPENVFTFDENNVYSQHPTFVSTAVSFPHPGYVNRNNSFIREVSGDHEVSGDVKGDHDNSSDLTGTRDLSNNMTEMREVSGDLTEERTEVIDDYARSLLHRVKEDAGLSEAEFGTLLMKIECGEVGSVRELLENALLSYSKPDC